jgi:hypothetical protein
VNVLFLILDGLSPRHVRPEVMPTLTAMAEEGGWNRDGGVAVMPASTYPNHASFATGMPPADHGLWSAKVPRPLSRGGTEESDGASLVNAWDLGPSVPTLFDWCAAAGRQVAAVLGDHHLVGTMGAEEADRVWPAGGEFGPEVARDVLGYADDRATAAEIAKAVADGPDLVVAQLNGPDTAAHLYGPDGEEALAAYRYNDEAIALVREALSARWHDWVVMVVSDHSQEESGEEFVDLDSALSDHQVAGRVILDGSAALVVGEAARRPGWLRAVDGVAGYEELADGAVVAWGGPGSSFGHRPWGVPGIHGSPRTRPQVAVVSGGHPEVEALARALLRHRPAATEWAGVIAGLLEITSGREPISRAGTAPWPAPGR